MTKLFKTCFSNDYPSFRSIQDCKARGVTRIAPASALTLVALTLEASRSDEPEMLLTSPNLMLIAAVVLEVLCLLWSREQPCICSQWMLLTATRDTDQPEVGTRPCWGETLPDGAQWNDFVDVAKLHGKIQWKLSKREREIIFVTRLSPVFHPYLLQCGSQSVHDSYSFYKICAKSQSVHNWQLWSLFGALGLCSYPIRMHPSCCDKGRQRFNEAFLAYVHRGTEKAPDVGWELVAYPADLTFGHMPDVFELKVLRARKVRTEHSGKYAYICELLWMFVDIIMKTLEFPITAWSILESDTMREGYYDDDLKSRSSCSVLWKGADGHCRNGTILYMSSLLVHIFVNNIFLYHI